MSGPAPTIDRAHVAEPGVVSGGETLWFLGTLARMKVEGRHTGGRFALWEAVMPHGAAPPLHSHPQDETLYVLEGDVSIWLVEPEVADEGGDPPGWVEAHGRRCGVGDVMFAPGGTPHTFRVESDTARMIVLSTPAGIEDMVRAFAEPAQWPWLPAPADGARISAEQRVRLERETGMVRHGPPPPEVHRDSPSAT